MLTIFNDKLYNKYYPLKTEEEKKEFLNNNYMEIYKMVNKLGRMAINEVYAIKHEYVSKMKPTISFLGRPKHRNISHNEYLYNKMLRDRRINNIIEKLPDLDSLSCKLKENNCEEITIEELNYILKFNNRKKHEIVVALFLLSLSIMALIYLFL